MNASSLPRRVALITGGGRGIGRAIALNLARDGFDVAINYARDREAAERVALLAREMGVRSCIMQGSVDVWDDCVRIVETAVEYLGSIAILVNNAGMPAYGAPLVASGEEDLRRAMAVNAFGAFYMSKLALPELRKHSRSDIIFIGSTSSALAAPYNGLYNMSKAAMDALARTLAAEERKNGVRVNIVAPTLTATDMGNGFAPLFDVDDLRDIDAISPFGRVCLPEDIASLVAYLVSPGNFYISGQRVAVDGAAGGNIAGAKVD